MKVNKTNRIKNIKKIKRINKLRLIHATKHIKGGKIKMIAENVCACNIDNKPFKVASDKVEKFLKDHPPMSSEERRIKREEVRRRANLIKEV